MVILPPRSHTSSWHSTSSRRGTLPYIDTITAKAFRTFIRVYTLFRSERLSANTELTLHEALIRSIITYSCSGWEFAADASLLKLQLLQRQGSPHHW